MSNELCWEVCEWALNGTNAQQRWKTNLKSVSHAQSLIQDARRKSKFVNTIIIIIIIIVVVIVTKKHMLFFPGATEKYTTAQLKYIHSFLTSCSSSSSSSSSSFFSTMCLWEKHTHCVHFKCDEATSCLSFLHFNLFDSFRSCSFFWIILSNEKKNEKNTCYQNP